MLHKMLWMIEGLGSGLFIYFFSLLVLYFHCRDKQSIFSTSEAEELVEVIVCLFLDHQLHGLVLLLYECLQSLISYFTDKEWKTSCNEIGKSLACRFLTHTCLFWIYILCIMTRYGAIWIGDHHICFIQRH